MSVPCRWHDTTARKQLCTTLRSPQESVPAQPPLPHWRGLPVCRASCRDSEEDSLLVEARIHDRGHAAKCNMGSDIGYRRRDTRHAGHRTGLPVAADAAGWGGRPIRAMPDIAPACRTGWGRWSRGKSFAERPEPDAPDGRCASCPLHGPAFFSALFRVPMYDGHALCIGVSATRLRWCRLISARPTGTDSDARIVQGRSRPPEESARQESAKEAENE